MTIQVKLFWDRIFDTYESNNGALNRMEKDMNEFLKDLRDDNVKDISIALNETQRVGLIVFRDYVVGSENNDKEIKIDVDQYSTKNPPPGYSSKEWGIVEKMIADKAFDD